MVLKALSLLLLVALFMPGICWADRQSRTTPLVKAVEAVGPAVVNISTTQQINNAYLSTGDPALDELFRHMFPPRRSQRGNLGSGVVIDGPRGIIVTNSHVVRAALAISVQLSDRREFPARLLGADPSNDIAVLKVDSELPQARLGDAGDIMIGEQVLAIGNPFGFSHTVTVGVVSALHRRVQTGADSYLGDLIQTDTSINPGNSGGPLLNIDGEVIGINTMIHRSAQGIGFAIPINKVMKVAQALSREKGAPLWLGFLLEDSEAKHPEISQEFCLSVKQVLANSPAAMAGLRAGDVVLAIDNWPLYSLPDYALALLDMQVGHSASLSVYREGKGMFKQEIEAGPFTLSQARQLFLARTGLQLANNMESAGGFKVLRATGGGIRAGDMVMAIGETDLKSDSDLLNAMCGQQAGGTLKVLLRRGNLMRWLAF